MSGYRGFRVCQGVSGREAEFESLSDLPGREAIGSRRTRRTSVPSRPLPDASSRSPSSGRYTSNPSSSSAAAAEVVAMHAPNGARMHATQVNRINRFILGFLSQEYSENLRRSEIRGLPRFDLTAVYFLLEWRAMAVSRGMA